MTDDNLRSEGFRFSRRRLLLGAAAGTVGATAALGPAHAGTAMATGNEIVDLGREHPFYGDGPQAGIHTPPQRYVFYMTFDLA